MAWRFVPRGGAYAPEGPPQRGSFPVIVRDHAFLVFLASSILASMTYVAFETLLPISLVSTHSLDPALWGFMVIVNPLLVTFLPAPADPLDGAASGRRSSSASRCR